jgi:hypothetical protein
MKYHRWDLSKPINKKRGSAAQYFLIISFLNSKKCDNVPDGTHPHTITDMRRVACTSYYVHCS